MPSSNRRPLIAIVGSLDPSRNYQPPLEGDLDTADAACREIGRELARSGCDLLIFSGKPKYAESPVAAGYVEAVTGQQPGRIVVRPARHQKFELDVPDASAVEVHLARDTSGEWEVTFYRSILAADGVLLVGGGQSTRVVGIVALAQGVPVLPVAAFGGGAGQVWVNLEREPKPVAKKDLELLGAPWSANSAAVLVGYLHREMRRRAEAHRIERAADRHAAREAALGRGIAGTSLVLALAAIAVVGNPGPVHAGALGLLLAAPMLAAVAGAITRDSFAVDQHWSRAAVRGLGAGVVTVLLYLAGQLLAVPDLLDRFDARRLMFFIVPLGFIAGFTFDLVFQRLRASSEQLPSAVPPSVVPNAGPTSL
jgi:hypothetical protein